MKIKKLFLGLFFLFGCTVFFAQNLTDKEKTGFYVSEKCIQEFNLKHSYTKIKKCYQEYSYPAFFIYNNADDSSVRNSMFYGEGISNKIIHYQFFKYNKSVYAIDDLGNYYFKISDYNPKNNYSYDEEFELYTKFFIPLLKNFVSDSNLEKYITDEEIDKLTIKSTYEEDYYIYSNDFKADFVLYQTNYEVTDDTIIVAEGKIDYRYKQTSFIYDSEVARFKYKYNNFQRNLNIILRNNDIVVPEELSTLSKDELRILRNAVYAKYGRPFVSEDLQKYFGNTSWYKVNKNFSETSFTIFDKRNIENIQAVEALLNSQ